MKSNNRRSAAEPRRRILVVDDHPMTRYGIIQLINEQPDLVACGEAGDAERALAAIASARPDLVLADITLPGKSGLDFVRELRVQHPVHNWMAATLDGVVAPGGAVFEAKFMLPWTFSEEAAAEKHMAQLQHNMWVANSRLAVLSIITGGGKWVELSIQADPLYQHLLLTAEKKFWRCVQDGEPPRLFGVEPPRPRPEAIRVVDMTTSNSWAELTAIYRRTRTAYQQHEGAKADLKKLVPEDAREAFGHGLRAKRSKSGALSFDLVDREAADAPFQ